MVLQQRGGFAKIRAPRTHNSEFISDYQRIAANARRFCTRRILHSD
jgi:hypothetical protein